MKINSGLKMLLVRYARENSDKEHITEFIVAAAYMMKLLQRFYDLNDYFKLINYIDHIDSKMREFVLRYVSGDVWEDLKHITASDDELNKIILSEYSDNYRTNAITGTPHSISKLAVRILDGKNGAVANFCAGRGEFLDEYVIESKNRDSNNYYGYELNEDAYIVAKIRKLILEEMYNVNIQYELEDPLTIGLPRFDGIFINLPIGKTKRNFEKYALYRKLGAAETTSDVWLYILKGLSGLNLNGTIVSVATMGSATNLGDKEVRKRLIESGYLKAVIQLPTNLFQSTAIATVLYIIENNTDLTPVRMINASELYKEERRLNVLLDQNIDEIMYLLDRDDKNKSITVSREMIAEKDYILNPFSYIQLSLLPKYGNERRLSDIVDIVRGAGYNAKHLDEITSVDQETDIKFLTISDVHDGIIEDELPYLKSYSTKDDKCLINTGDLVMSKIGLPIKFAVADFKDDKKVLANGNLYVLKIRDYQADPYYLQALFESEYGQTLLTGILKGAAIRSLSLKELKELMIPIPNMELQRKIGDEYKSILDKIKIYMQKKNEALKELSNVFYDEMSLNS